MSDVAHQDEVVRTLEKAIETANMPHMLFYGPPGTGKTTCALAICRQLYGGDRGEPANDPGPQPAALSSRP